MVRTRNVIILVIALFVLVGCTAALGGKPSWQKKDEITSDAIAAAALSAVPHPLAAIKAGGFLERKNLAERLTRFSKANKVGYVYLMSFGKFVGYYVIKGKISATESQMTTTVQTWDCGGADGACFVDSIGDDGSFGHNEGGAAGIFFFTSNGTMVETTLDWLYADQPLSVDVPNLLK